MKLASWRNEPPLHGRFYAVAPFARRIAIVTVLPEKRAFAGQELKPLSHRGMSIVERNPLLAAREELAQSFLAIVRPDARIARIFL